MKSSAVKSAKKASGPSGPAGSTNSAAISSVPPLASSAGSKIKINESSEKLELQEVLYLFIYL